MSILESFEKNQYEKALLDMPNSQPAIHFSCHNIYCTIKWVTAINGHDIDQLDLFPKGPSLPTARETKKNICINDCFTLLTPH